MRGLEKVWIPALIASFVALAAPTLAQPGGHQATAASTKGWVFSAGIFDFVDQDKAGELGLGYRLEPFYVWKIPVVPAFGVAGNTEGSFWVYTTARIDWELSDGWYFTPNLGVSIYEEGDGKDLGGSIEFRSGLEVSRRLPNGSRLGVLFYHLSNSRIYELNPGEESLVLTWSLGR